VNIHTEIQQCLKLRKKGMVAYVLAFLKIKMTVRIEPKQTYVAEKIITATHQNVGLAPL
jgi:hypothetical protein